MRALFFLLFLARQNVYHVFLPINFYLFLLGSGITHSCDPFNRATIVVIATSASAQRPKGVTIFVKYNNPVLSIDHSLDW